MIENLRILVVDDQPAEIKPYIDYFLFKGHRALTAVNGEEGLKVLMKGGIDCVILDIMMPKMSGDVMLSYAVQYPELCELTYAILSVLTNDDDYDLVSRAYRQAAKNIKGGFHRFFKPTDPDKILEALERDVEDIYKNIHRMPGDYQPIRQSCVRY